MKSKKCMSRVVASSLLVMTLLSGCTADKAPATASDTVKVKVMTVGESASTEGYSYSGTVEEETATSLSFQAMGTITKLNAKVGDRITKGQLIATIDPTTARNAFEMAHSVRQQAEDAYRRMKQLHDKGSLSEIKWIEAQSQLQQAVSSENIAQKSLADCKLYSPVSGVVSEKLAEAGQNVAPGQPILKIASSSILNVKVSIPESEIASVSIKQQAGIIVPALNDRHYSGYVVEKGVIADPLSRSYDVKVRVNAADTQLLPGMITKVSLAGKSSTTDIIIPVKLVQLADDNTYFVWVNEGGKATKRTVTVGEYTANGVKIVSGLQSGTQVITDGQQKVCNGTKIAVK